MPRAALAVVCLLLGACSGPAIAGSTLSATPAGEATQAPTTAPTTTPAVDRDPPPLQTPTPDPVADSPVVPTSFPCSRPQADVVRWAAVSTGEHTVRWRAAVLVPAGSMGPVHWFVLATERQGADGRPVREAALTNHPGRTGVSTLIRLPGSDPDHLDWSDVAWSGERLAGGRAAARAAFACLDAGRGTPVADPPPTATPTHGD